MKKTIFGIFTASILLIACNKTDLQQATDTIKNADSLFQEAKESYKTLDSISKVVNDSTGKVSKIILPEIEKHREEIENQLKSGNLSLDSLNREFQKIKERTKNKEEITKAIDSITKAVNNGEVNSVKDIEETVNKVIKQAKKEPAPEVQEQHTIPQEEVKISPNKIEIQPIVKSTKLEIEVDDLVATKAILEQNLRNNNGEILTDNYSETEGIAHQYITIKVPLSSYNNLVDSVSNLGQITSKSSEVQGKDYIANQMCDVEITITDKTPENNSNPEDLNILNQDEKPKTFGEKFSDAFSKGFDGLGSGLIALIPFWPLFLIIGIVWYFVAKRNKKKREEEFQRQLAIEREKIKAAEAAKSTVQEVPQNTEQPINEEKKDDDLSKYMPKD